MVGIQIDFGNGISAYTRPAAGANAYIERGSSGLDVPELDIVVTEGVSDGGSIESSRANARHIRMTIVHDRKWTRVQIKQAFTPGVERTVSSPTASMPYYVEALEFPDNLWEAERRFTVSLVSPLAYPLGSLLTKSAATSLTYTTTDYNASGSEVAPGDSDWFEIGTSFMVSAGQTLTSVGLYIKGGSKVESREINVYQTVNSNRLATAIKTAYITVNYPGWKYYDVALNKSFTAATQVTVGIWMDPTTELSFIDQPEGSYPNRSNFSRVTYNMEPVITAGSYRMRDTRGASAASTTEVYVDSETELPCYPKVTVTLASAASALTISDGTRTATITGSMASGAVVVLDSAARTVTVNGTNRLAWFDRTGDWPMLYPGVSKLTTSVTGSIAVEWQPRMMGLV